MANRELFDLLPLFCKLFSRYPSNTPLKSSISGSTEAKHPLTMFSCGRTKKLAGEHLNRYFLKTAFFGLKNSILALFCKLDSPSPSNISFKSLLVRLQRQNTPLTMSTRGNQKIEDSTAFKTRLFVFHPKPDQI